MDKPAFNDTQYAFPYRSQFLYTFWILSASWPGIILFGLFANVANIVIFLKAGVKDNVTTLLLSLSVSDLIFLFLLNPIVCSSIILNHAPDWQWPFSTTFTFSLFYWPAYTFYAFSSYISVWLGVTRCACVAMPLQFKSVFTKSRTVTAVLALFVLAVSLHVPMMSMFTIAWSREPQSNVSFPHVIRQSSDSIIRFNDALNRTSLPWIHFIILIACVAIIKLKLYQSSRVRGSQTSTSNPKQATEGVEDQGRSSKDLRVIKSVVLICCIFIVSQLPFLVYSTGRLINPEFDVYQKLQNLFYIFTTISQTFSYLNASVNIFVYYNYNSKYSSIFLSMTRSKPTKTSEVR